MIPNAITLAQAGRMSAAVGAVSPATVRIIPAVATVTDPVIPSARPATGPAAYFGLFRACDCGHSSAWHSGAFGDAWRAGEQVNGRCEANADESSAQGCSCTHFQEPSRAS